jgi:hypothetical protein
MSTNTTVGSLRQRMIEDMTARKLGSHSQRSHIHSCRRFAAFLNRNSHFPSRGRTFALVGRRCAEG